jgi:hypothetical protein
MTTRERSFILLAATAALVSTEASAFVCTRASALGPSVFWSVRTVTLRPSGEGAEVGAESFAQVLRRGAEAWTAPSCSDLSLVVEVPTETRVVGFNWHAGSGSERNENVVMFRNQTEGDPVDRWVHTLGALAITTVTFDTRSGRLLDADIEINDLAFDFSTCDPTDQGCSVSFDLENTLTHELGHVLGLDHPPNASPGASEATMFASASRGDTEKRSLAPDDVDGVCLLYPAGDPVAGECYGVGRPAPSTLRFEQSCAAGVSPGSSLVVLLVCAARRRRRLQL